MAFSLGDAFVEIQPRLTRGFAEATERAVTVALTGVTTSIGKSVEELGSTLTRKLTVPIAIGTAANITQFQALDSEIRNTITLFGAGGSQVDTLFGQFREGIRGVSDDLGVFEQSISQGLYQAISAGIPQDNVFEFLTTAQQAAIGGSLDLTTAVNGLTTAVNTFAADGLTASDAADVLFRGVARGKTTFEELSREMAAAAPLAANAGISFDELIGSVASMTLAGTTTSEAFTQVRAAITGLLRPSEEMEQIFRDVGFETQSNAVKTLGYQGALQVLFEATEGEVGALIKLLGGAEAANAALQVTGDNAARTRDILDDTANATGAAASAFDTMQDSAGRTFGRLFAQIDRFGTNLGELAFDIVRPFVNLLTGMVGALNAAVEWFSRLPEPIRLVGTGLVLFAGTVGPLLIIMGKLLPLLALMGVRFLSIGKILKAINLGSLLRIFAASLAQVVATATRGIPALAGVTNAMTGLRNAALAPLIKALGGTALAWSGVGIAIAAVVAGGIAYERWQSRIIEQNRVVVDGARKLAESLGLVVEPVKSLQQEGDIGVDFDFRAENVALIEDVRQAQRDGLLEDRLVRISYQLLALGNQPDDVEQALEQLAQAAGITIPINFEIPEGPADVESTVDGLLNQIDRIINTYEVDLINAVDFSERTLQNFFDDTPLAIKGQLQSVGEELAGVFSEGNYTDAIAALRTIESTLGSISPEGLDEVIFGFIEFINESQGLDISTRGLTDVNDVIGLLTQNLGFASYELEGVTNEWDEFYGAMYAADVQTATTKDGVEDTSDALREQYAALGEARIGLQEFASEIQNNVMARLGELQGEMAAQIPLFGEYEGAAKRTPEEIIHSLEHFTEDLIAWNDLYVSLAKELPAGVRDQLNQLPLEQRAALAKMAEETPGEFDDVIAAYNRAFETTQSEGEDLWLVELPGLIEEGNALILQKARFLESQFSILGKNTAANWSTEFAKIASSWPALVQQYANAAILAFPLLGGGLFGDFPTVPGAGGGTPTPPTGPPLPTDFGQTDELDDKRTRQNIYNIEFNNPSVNDLETDATKALGVIQTTQLWDEN